MNWLTKKHLYTLSGLLAGLLVSFQVAAGVVVIVNPGANISEITPKQAKSLFLGKAKKLPDGEKAKVVDQSKSSASREVFLKKVLKKSEKKLKAYWSKQVFSGKASPPKQLDDDAAVKSFVSSTAGAIGYIDSASLDDSVKPVLTID